MKVIIVGGVAGGAGTAARLRRLDEKAEIIMFERGGHISYANCGLPYYVGGVIQSRDSLLVQTVEGMKERFNIDIRINSEVVDVKPEVKSVTVRQADGGYYIESYDKLVLAPGAEPVKPNLPGVELEGVYRVRSVEDALSIRDAAVGRGLKKAAVVGAGFIGLEMAENLRAAGMDVTLIEYDSQVMAPMDAEMAVYLQKELMNNGVDVKLGCGLSAIEKSGSSLSLKTTDGGETEAELVVLAIGVKPETELAKAAGLEISPLGGIKVDDHMRTSVPDIYAIGDAVVKYNYLSGEEEMLNLAGPANRQARIAADNIAGRDTTFDGVQGTYILKLFGLTAASTGLSEKKLKKLGVEYMKLYTHPASNATYYPGGAVINIKVLYAPDGRLLGAQAVGAKGVDKRIDVLATVIALGGSVYDLEELELCYAPPFGAAKDPVNMAGFVAAATLKGDSHLFQWDDPTMHAKNAFLVDIRTPEEVGEGSIPGAVNIPVDEIRDRLAEFPKDRPIYVFCRVGMRGYIAERILRGNGFDDVYNMTGGYLTYIGSQL